MDTKTIAAISTARGQGGIGVIRVSGDESIKIVNEIFVSSSLKNLDDLRGYSAAYGRICNNGECLDEAVVLVFRAPHSYTGEDVVEISCHGGIFVTEQILKLVLKNGAKPAEPGEFTKRAFLNGKMDLTKAESVMDIIMAKGKQAARSAVALMSGALSKKINNVKAELLHAAAHISAFVDYPDDDIPDVDNDFLMNVIEKSQKTLQCLLDNFESGKIMREGISTAIVGKPNVGKSTLMNLLLGCDRCIVTEIPGTTRDVVEETAVLGDIILNLSDTAGIRDTSDLVESIGVGRAREKIDQAQLVLAVFDSSRDLNSDDFSLINSLKGVPTVAVVNKTDLGAQVDCEYIEQKIGRIVHFSAVSGDGLKALETAIAETLKVSKFDSTQGNLCTGRQYDAVNSAVKCLDEARDALSCGVTLDAVSISIEAAVDELLKLTGERVTESVTEEVFSRFCVGK